ncbi:MAG: hypothetical protein M3R50_09060 [Bacteroidota bacterium]|nr:hypothetical protein [Bacteroidota bacterium]
MKRYKVHIDGGKAISSEVSSIQKQDNDSCVNDNGKWHRNSGSITGYIIVSANSEFESKIKAEEEAKHLSTPN